MSILQIIFSSIRFYRRSWLGVLAGCAITGMVLTGALLVGDSVRATLSNIALQRLGNASLTMNSDTRYFSTSLEKRVNEKLKTNTAALLKLRGMAIYQADEDRRQANNVQVLGVADSFWKMTDDFSIELGEGEAAINSRLARELNLKPGSEISLRIEKPALLPRDSLLSSRSENLTSRQIFTVKAIIDDDNLGRFSLSANQIAPYNVFIDISSLQVMADMPGKANIMLLESPDDENPLTAGVADAALAGIWQLEDLGIRLRIEKELGVLQVESERIFIEEPIAAALKDDSTSVLTYMVNRIYSDKGSTPYSFMAAQTPSKNMKVASLHSEIRDGEIVINSWLAEKLSVRAGDSVTVEWSSLLSTGKLKDLKETFKVTRILEIGDIGMERKLTPEFPGLTDVDSCSDWNVGLPMEKKALEDEANEKYWNEYGATPKAFITIKDGNRIWSNKFGSTTALRFPEEMAETIQNKIRTDVSPSELGYFFQPSRELALKAVSEAMDLGQLFLGMSFFLIIAALMLTAFLFGLNVKQRLPEAGIMLAVGLRPWMVKSMFMLESAFVAVLGSAIGSAAAIVYTRLLLMGLASRWSGVVAGAAIEFHAGPLTPFTGAVSAFICAMLVILISVHRQLKLTPGEQITDIPDQLCIKRGHPLIALSAAVIAIAASIVIMLKALDGAPQHMVHSFFGAGALLLAGILGFTYFSMLVMHKMDLGISSCTMALNNITRNRARSMAISALLATGCFLVFATSSMKENIAASPEKLSSGTGGYELFAQSTVPLLNDLNDKSTQTDLRLDRETELKGIKVFNIKVKEGDDSSCLNLNHALNPPLLGIDPDLMAESGAFLKEGSNGNLWELLNEDLPDGVIPALAGDSDTAMWGLQMKTDPENGGILTYKDESGHDVRIKLVGKLPMRLSLFQGNILVSAENFARLYPSESGYRMFLINLLDREVSDAARNALNKRLERYGFDAVHSTERLQEFYSVESSYLAMFLTLGALGLLLGSAGTGAVAWRNIIERRSELALMRCVGFTNRRLWGILIAEHTILIADGITTGLCASLVAMIPNIRSAEVDLPVTTIIISAVAIFAFSTLVTIAAAWAGTRGSMIEALRKE